MTQSRTKLKKLLPIKEAAEWLGISPATLRAWDNKGLFKATRHTKNSYRLYSLQMLQKLATRRNLGPKPRRKLVD